MSDPQAQTEPEQQGKEPLQRMGFGDHLEELRRRLFICLGTLFVLIMVMMPFKAQVTDIYVQPYRDMWLMAYEEYLEGIEKNYRQTGLDQMADAKHQALEFFEEHAEGIASGDYADAQALATEGGFSQALILPGKPGRDAWLQAYGDHGQQLQQELATKAEQHMHEASLAKVLWNRKWSGEVLDGVYPEPDDIKNQGGFPMPWTLLAIGGLEDFWTFLAAALLFSVLLASPVILWQAWGFVAVGLYKKERAMVYKFMPFSIVLGMAGALFSFYFVVPYGFFFLSELMNWAQVTLSMTVGPYFKLFLTLTVVLSLVFQLPLVMLALQKVGLVSHQAMLKNWRWMILSFFLLSAMLTPPDPFTQVLMAGPMVLLFLLGLFLTWRSDLQRRRAQGAVGDAS